MARSEKKKRQSAPAAPTGKPDDDRMDGVLNFQEHI